MEFANGILQLDPFLTTTMGIIVLFVGKRLNSGINFLKEFSIPEPVSGGLFFSILIALIYLLSGIEIEFNLAARDILLVYFFTTIGINASLKDLLKGGTPLIILLVVTIGYMLLQNVTGVSIASLFDMPAAVGMLGGSISLIGGHGTAIAWAPRIAEGYGVSNAMEMGIACATFGLILASIMGGPMAKFLITRHNLEPEKIEPLDIGIPDSQPDKNISHLDLLDAVLAIHMCIIPGVIFNEWLESVGFPLPLFVTCLFAGILITNFIPDSLPRFSGVKWPSRKPAIALIAEVALGTFLAMSLMSMQLWTLVDLAGPIITILGAQFLLTIVITIFVVFPAMGKNYDAAVICAGFGGFSMGATPTAMANMSAVSQRYGASHIAFIIVPLVCAFFIDLANAFIIPFFLSNF